MSIERLIKKIKVLSRDDIRDALTYKFNSADTLIEKINDKLNSDSAYAEGERLGDIETEIDEDSIYFPESPEFCDHEFKIKRIIEGTSSFSQEIDIPDHAANTTDTITGESYTYKATVTEECTYDLDKLNQEQINELITDISEKDFVALGDDLEDSKTTIKILSIELEEQV
ncbi:hypothetical protein [Lactiplantibacillus plantarum]